MTTDNGGQEQQWEWEAVYDPESKMWGIWWADNDPRGCIGDVYTKAYADRILADHAQAALAQRWREALEEADLRFSVIHNRANDFSDSYDGDLAAIDLETIRQLAAAAREDIAARLRALAPSAGQED